MRGSFFTDAQGGGKCGTRVRDGRDTLERESLESMWEWRVWLPLSKETPADVTALLGADIEVEQSNELHYKVADTSVDLRRVHVKTQKHARAWEGNGSKGESLMLLRVRRGLKWTTCIERWVAISKLSLRDEDFLTEELDDRVMACCDLPVHRSGY